MAEVGHYALLTALFLSAYSALSSLLGAKARRTDFISSGERAAFVATGLLTVASLALIFLLIQKDFSIEYVASHVNRALPFFYTLSAFWAGQKGSLLLWGWLVALFGIIALLQYRKKHREMMPYVNAVCMGTAFFFVLLMIASTDPFERLSFVPIDGQGLNPLLQNPGMVLHPPTLYLGYVGFTVPFAFALAALATGKLDAGWIRTTRRWTLFSWFFLGLGILLGAKWAYVELGWGGYWGWDPVENASLMPWLTGTAFLHSMMIQEKRGMLKVWNLVLINVTFSLCIFGTFITRSGVISSVHAFGQSSIGYFFLVFMVGVVIFFIWLILHRLPLLQSENALDSLVSRESSFLFNNLILVGAAFAVFWGTIFPLISEAVRGVKVTVGPPFFNQVNVPIGLALLFLTGVCPLIAWRRASWRNLKRNFLTPTLATFVGVVVLVAAGVRHSEALIAFALAVFVVASVLLEFLQAAQARRRLYGRGWLWALASLAARNKRRYGGYVIHLGMVAMFVGFAGSSAFRQVEEVVLKKGEDAVIGNYRLRYEGLSLKRTPLLDSITAELSVSRNGVPVGKLWPEKRRYHKPVQPTTEVAIRSTLKEDLYAIFADFQADGRASFKFLVNPLVTWIWLGGLILTLGTIVVYLPRRMGQRKG